jgi:predicted Zn-dependent protease with MMP-like domain
MQRQRFESLVLEAIDRLPPEFQAKLENVDIIVEDWPSNLQLGKLRLRHSSQLLGLYEGVPQTMRDRGYNMVLPDKITIFQRPIEQMCSTNSEIEKEIEQVVLHEIAHHFGIGDQTLKVIEAQKLRNKKKKN